MPPSPRYTCKDAILEMVKHSQRGVFLNVKPWKNFDIFFCLYSATYTVVHDIIEIFGNHIKVGYHQNFLYYKN